LKFVVADIYANYTTEIINDEDMEQLDGYVGGRVSPGRDI
jgi:hypothetical protein